jgi:hypothetical protein
MVVDTATLRAIAKRELGVGAEALVRAAGGALVRLAAAQAAGKRRAVIASLQAAITDLQAIGGDASALQSQLTALQADAASGHDIAATDMDREAALRGRAVVHCLLLLLPDGSDRMAVADFAHKLQAALGEPKRGGGGRKPRGDAPSSRGDGKTYRAKHSDGREFVNRGRPDAMAWRIRKSDATLTPDMVNAAIGRLRRGESTSEQVGPWTVTVETE